MVEGIWWIYSRFKWLGWS